MLTLTRREGLTLALGTGAAASVARRGLAQPARNVLIGGFDVGPGGYPGNFNPLAATAGFQWLNLYYDTLVLYTDATLEKIGGALAERAESNADKTRYTFHLRPGVKWHDGADFTSADVAFTIELAKDSRSGSIFSSRLGDIARVTTPDAMTAIFELNKPNGALLDVLTKLMMVPKHALDPLPREGLDRNPWWSKTPVGTGPFSFVRYETDQFVELKANPGYRRGRPKLDGVINRYFRNSANGVDALRAGEIQFSYVEADEAQTFKGNAGFHIIPGNSWVLNYIGFNYATDLWNDVRIRQAMLHALNRQALIGSILKGAAEVANACYIAKSVTPAGLDPYPYDPAKAKQLLAAAGWEKINGAKPLAWLTYYNNPLVENLMAAMQAMLGEVGVHVVPRLVDVATYNGIVYAQKPDLSQYPLVYAGAQNGPEPGAINMYTNESQIPPNGANIMRVRDHDLNAALNAALGEPDDAKRPGRFQAVARTFNRNLPWAPLWVGTRYGIITSNVANFVWTPAPSGGGYEQRAETWAFV
jgi:peptide/nickel transport system substrate-binding protein